MSSYSLISSNCSYLDVLISIFQCPSHLFSQYVRFLVALGSLYIIPHFTLKIENFNLVTLSMLTFLSSCTRLGCHNISSWEWKKEKWMKNSFQTTNLDKYGLFKGNTHILFTAAFQICQLTKKNCCRMKKEFRTLKFSSSVYGN